MVLLDDGHQTSFAMPLMQPGVSVPFMALAVALRCRVLKQGAVAAFDALKLADSILPSLS